MNELLFEDMELKSFLNRNQHNNWKDTPFEKYVGLSTKNKGCYGEMVVEKFMKQNLNSIVDSPQNPGHDRIIDNFKTEIKFSLANSPMDKKKNQKLINPDEFTFNHLAINKDWDRFIFFGINPEFSNPRVNWDHSDPMPPEIRAYFMSKTDFTKHMDTSQLLFSRQQGGAKGGNDDYMLAGYNKFQKLIDLPFVRPVVDFW